LDQAIERLRMNAIVDGILLIEGREIKGKALLYDERIRGIVGPGDIPENCGIIGAQGLYVSPGLIDIHVHGYLGEDASDGSVNGLQIMAEALLKNGVTAFLPTTMTVKWDDILLSLTAIRSVKRLSTQRDFKGSEILGVHMEGPFISPMRKGAQAEDAIAVPDADRILSLGDVVRIVTVAPEMSGGHPFIKRLRKESDIIVSIGHSDASFEQAMEAITMGVSHITHLFNAMSGLNHRAPGVVGAALTAPVSCELIADTFHVHPGLFSLLLKVKKESLVLVSDCTRAGGLGDGRYTLGGQGIEVKGIQSRLNDGTIAGSVLKLNEGVRNFRDHTGITTAEAVQFASINAAKAIKADREKGSLEPGKDADIALFDRDMNVFSVFTRGNLKYVNKDLDERKFPLASN